MGTPFFLLLRSLQSKMAYQPSLFNLPQVGLQFDNLKQALNELGDQKEDVQSDETDDELYNEYRLSWLLLGCPGSISHNNARVRCRTPARGAKVFDDQSTWDAQLTAESARKRIKNWLKTPADEYVFYFGGHGGEGCIGFAKDSALEYEELAELVNKAKFRNKKAPLVTIIIDSCHSGSIYEAFRPYQQSKYSEKCENDRGVLFQVLFSSLPHQTSADEAFSKWLFGPKRVKLWTEYFVNGFWDRQKWSCTFPGQQSGCFDFRPGNLHISPAK